MGEGQLPGQSSLSPTASAPSHSKHPGNACQMNMSSHPVSLTVSRERTLIVFLHLQSRTHQVWWCAPVLTPMAKVILSYTGDSGPARASEDGARLSGRCPERSDRASKGQEAKGRQTSRGLTHGALGVKKKRGGRLSHTVNKFPEFAALSCFSPPPLLSLRHLSPS